MRGLSLISSIYPALDDAFCVTFAVRLQVKVVFKMLCNQLSVEAFVQNMLSDINNQSKSAERLINHLCIFDWAKRELSEKDAHSVFYDEERASEYK